MKMVLHLGYDGSYVVSRAPLEVTFDPAGGDGSGLVYLSPVTGKCLDIPDLPLVLGKLKLNKFEVVKMSVDVSKKKKLSLKKAKEGKKK